ncbi:MAG: DUF4145 domain-containing protein [Neisseria sp.]|nr:DUF4145 domain-containing protein [Neisseria sp.]
METPKTILKAHCNICGGKRNHEQLKLIEKRWSDGNKYYEIDGGDLYILLECMGCESVKVLHESWFSEETDEEGYPITTVRYYPSSIFRPKPNWLWLLDKEWHVTKLLNEIYQALQNDAPSLAAMGVRAVIEAIMIDKVGDHGSFVANLKEFQNKGYISSLQLGILEVALEMGHATIHRAFVPKVEQLEVALDTLESLIHALYLLEDQAKHHAKFIPKRDVQPFSQADD